MHQAVSRRAMNRKSQRKWIMYFHICHVYAKSVVWLQYRKFILFTGLNLYAYKMDLDCIKSNLRKEQNFLVFLTCCIRQKRNLIQNWMVKPPAHSSILLKQVSPLRSTRLNSSHAGSLSMHFPWFKRFSWLCLDFIGKPNKSEYDNYLTTPLQYPIHWESYLYISKCICVSVHLLLSYLGQIRTQFSAVKCLK